MNLLGGIRTSKTKAGTVRGGKPVLALLLPLLLAFLALPAVVHAQFIYTTNKCDHSQQRQKHWQLCVF
ncbi:exported hypothetical protein [Verrucomicrobia bacterium]|nr:exported hypothetical protein [Verrucomicrobiota bacterium]